MKRLGIPVILLCGILLVGCSSQKQYNSPGSDGNTALNKVIPGENVSEQKDLYDITEVISKGDYSPKLIHAYSDNQILVVYDTGNGSEISAFDLKKEKIVKSVRIDNDFSEVTKLGVTSGGMCYLFDKMNSVFTVVDIEKESSSQYRLEVMTDSVLVSESANRIYFTQEGKNKIFQYITETQNINEVYLADENIDSIYLKSMISDEGTFLTKVKINDEMHYARITVEEQELTMLDNISGDMQYTGKYYVIKNPAYEKSIGVFDDRKPRLFCQFSLESSEEVNGIRLIDNSQYFFSAVNSEISNRKVFRFYDIDSGILTNEMNCDKTYELEGYSFMYDIHALCLNLSDAEGKKHFYIWDVENVSDVMK